MVITRVEMLLHTLLVRFAIYITQWNCTNGIG